MIARNWSSKSSHCSGTHSSTGGSDRLCHPSHLCLRTALTDWGFVCSGTPSWPSLHPSWVPCTPWPCARNHGIGDSSPGRVSLSTPVIQTRDHWRQAPSMMQRRSRQSGLHRPRPRIRRQEVETNVYDTQSVPFSRFMTTWPRIRPRQRKELYAEPKDGSSTPHKIYDTLVCQTSATMTLSSLFRNTRSA